MERVYNFSPGPACLPLPVLEKAAKEMTLYGKTGMSVMELSHRSKAFLEIIQVAEKNLRSLMDIPENYKVLFLQGGASSQFAMVPLNLFKNRKADFVKTGQWAKKAIEQAKAYGSANVVASSEDKIFSYIPVLDPSEFSPDADYFHITLNNTIYGTRFTLLPDVSAPLVADASSIILSQAIDVSKFGVIYAGAQKNFGPSGLCAVVIREDLIGKALPETPIMFNYKTHADEGSLYNTPPTYSIYIANLVFEWLKDQGGVAGIQKVNEEKAALLYGFLDGSSLFKGTAEVKDRSIMNVPFVTGSEETDESFIKEATAAGLVNLKGHRTVGGMRASIYNAMPIEGVQRLVEFMKEYEAKALRGKAQS
ncbi:MAG: 3-phosphoserine/phosphohydroxythreonine transaminase [Clostridiales bacterium]|jgi:phosphoserine aminotransferase|nr:3-phosphoserine/phosphohydroxythreonine transaminase [Clostridiales bacterium]